MNKVYLLSLIIFAFLVNSSKTFAQTTLDFESGANGASYTWTTFENDDNPVLSIETNPDATGINTSSTVAKFTARLAGEPYAGVESAHGDFGPLTFSVSNSTVKMMVYKSVISDVGIKFAESNGEAQPEVKVANTKMNEWEELTFDLSGSIGAGVTGILDQIIVFPDFADRSQENVIYFDNISFSEQIEAAVPTVAAPTPTTASENVISVFSDAYTSVSGTDFDPDWGQGTDATQVDIAGNNTLKYDNLNYQGIALGSAQDVSGMNFLHIDFWTSNATSLQVSLISTGPLENASTLAITNDIWVSVDVPLTDFTTPSLDDIIQLKFDGNGTVYLDNIYFTSEEFMVPTETSLSDLQVDGVTIPDFSVNQLTYIYELEEGTTVVPTVTATSTDNTSTVDITAASGIPGTTTIDVTDSEDESTSTYSVSFKFEEIPPSSLPIDFEGEGYGFVDFGGGVATVIDNPNHDGDNGSAKVAQMVRNGGEVFAGSKLILAEMIDFSENNAFRMKVYSPRVGVPMLFKLEGPSAAKEVSVNTSVANAWEIMEWDFTETASNTYNEVVFIFDFGAVGDGSANSTFLFDDVELFDNTGGLSQIDLPVDFEGSTVNYTLTDFGDTNTVLGADPDDASNKVAITTKPTGAPTWAGTTVGTPFGFANDIPFTGTETKLNVKVYSPAAGLPIRLKIEDHNDVTLTAEAEVNTTKADEWEILTFDFSNVVSGTNPFNLATNFDMLSIFFNFGTEGTNQVFYWDDVLFGEGMEVVKPEVVLGVINDGDVIVHALEGHLFVRCSEASINSRIEVYSLSGKKVIDAVLENTHMSYMLNGKGLFIVNISGKNGVLSTKIYLD